jgi:DNA end-binding protein Ku
MPRSHATRAKKTSKSADEPAARGRGIWSGTITFGLVSIPVELYSASRPGRPGLRYLAPSGRPVQRRYASVEGKEVPAPKLVRGFEVAPGKHVVVTDAELEALAPKMSRDIDLARFVPVDEIDPLFFERAYFLFPGGASTKAYRLLADVMERTGRAGIATFVMRGKEYLAAILAEGGVLRAETLRFADEVRTAEQIGLPKPTKVPAAAVAKLERAIASRAAAKLDPDELADPWAERLEALAEKKRKQKADVVRVEEEAEAPRAEIIDLMAILKESLGTSSRRGGRKPARTAAAARAPRAGGGSRAAASHGTRRRSA